MLSLEEAETDLSVAERKHIHPPEESVAFDRFTEEESNKIKPSEEGSQSVNDSSSTSTSSMLNLLTNNLKVNSESINDRHNEKLPLKDMVVVAKDNITDMNTKKYKVVDMTNIEIKKSQTTKINKAPTVKELQDKTGCQSRSEKKHFKQHSQQTTINNKSSAEEDTNNVMIAADFNFYGNPVTKVMNAIQRTDTEGDSEEDILEIDDTIIVGCNTGGFIDPTALHYSDISKK